MLISGWLNTSNIPAGKYAQLQVQWNTETGGNLGEDPVGGLAGTNDWTYVSKTFTAPPTEATRAVVRARLDSDATGGNAYYDDIRVMIIDNKLKNGSFEKGLTRDWKSISTIPTITTTLGNVRGGAQALEMVGGSNYYQTSQTFTATEYTSYTISGWIKTDNIPTGKAKIHLEWYDRDGRMIEDPVPIGSNVTDPDNPNANAYTQISADETSPVGTVSGKVIMRLVGGTTGGTAWYDDVYVKLRSGSLP